MTNLRPCVILRSAGDEGSVFPARGRSAPVGGHGVYRGAGAGGADPGCPEHIALPCPSGRGSAHSICLGDTPPRSWWAAPGERKTGPPFSLETAARSVLSRPIFCPGSAFCTGRSRRRSRSSRRRGGGSDIPPPGRRTAAPGPGSGRWAGPGASVEPPLRPAPGPGPGRGRGRRTARPRSTGAPPPPGPSAGPSPAGRRRWRPRRGCRAG